MQKNESSAKSASPPEKRMILDKNDEKITTRRLNRMKENRLLDFSLQCSPAAMIGYILFVILITVTKFYYHNVIERIYSEFQANILYRPSIIEPEDRLTFVLWRKCVYG
jgi:hypothetical protein